MRSVRSEMLSVLTVLAIPALIFACFPYGVFGFAAARRESVRATSVAFVTLSDAATAAAMKAAKSPWQNSLGATRNLRADLRFGELPAATPEPVLTAAFRGKIAASAAEEYGFAAFGPSQAATDSIAIAKESSAPPPPAFSKAEMLKLE